MQGRTVDLSVKVASTVAVAVVLLGVFGPWLLSGASTRSSFEMLDIVERLGFTPSGPVRFVLALWPLVPLIVVSACVINWSGRRRLAAGLGVLGSVYVGAVSMVLLVAPETSLVRTGWGVIASAAGAVLLGAVSFARWFVRHSPQPDASLDHDVTK